MKIGEFLIDKQYISQEQLDSALALQKDNSEILLGDILITQGVLTKDELVSFISDYIKSTGNSVERKNEWLNQEEIDKLMAELK